MIEDDDGIFSSYHKYSGYSVAMFFNPLKKNSICSNCLLIEGAQSNEL